MKPDRAGLAGSTGSQRKKDAGRPDSHNRSENRMPNIMFGRRPTLSVTQEVRLHTARAYVHSRLFDNEVFKQEFKPELHPEEKPPDLNDENLSIYIRRKRIPKPYELRLFGIDPKTFDPATFVHPRDKYPDLNCLELEAVYDAIFTAVQTGRPKDHPDLMQALGVICDRLKISRPNPQDR